jgi:hypothetical protein
MQHHLELGEVTAAVSESIAKNEAIRIDELKYTRDDGMKGLLGLTINPLLSDGDLMEGFIIVGRDITDRVQIENQLLQARSLRL